MLSCALAALLLAAPAALAQTGPPTPEPQEIARRCVEAIGQTTHAVVTHSGNLAQHGVRVIAALDHHGAPPPVLIYVARNVGGAINRTAQNGARSVNQIAYACVMVLDEVGAGPKLIGVVIGARNAALTGIGVARERATGAVREALERALMDGVGAVAM